MPKCSDCGFAEKQYCLRKDPVTGKLVGSSELISVKCLSDMTNPKQINDPYVDRTCKHFQISLPEMSLKDHHEFRDRHVSARKNYRISVVALVISIVSVIALISSVAIPLLTPTPPEVDLKFHFLNDMTGPVDYTFSAPFTLYNQGIKICFIEVAYVYEVFENGTLQDVSNINDAKQTTINPGDIEEFNFEIYNLPGEKGTKQYRILIVYEPNNSVWSPIITVKWF